MASVSSSTGLIPLPAAPLIRVGSVAIDSYPHTVGVMCDLFLESKSAALGRGDLHPRTHKRYVEICNHAKNFLSATAALTQLRPMDFSAYRKSFPMNWGPVAIGAWIQGTRTMFKFAYDAELIEHPMRFGPDFKRPSRKLYRRARREKGLQMFEAEEIRKLLDRGRPIDKAMILLGINCAFGNTDCAQLPFPALDLESGWVNLHRTKTEIDRRCPLWPETVAAIKRAILIRKRPANAALAGYVFLTRTGNSWAHAERRSELTRRFASLMRRSAVARRRYRSFYGLRRTFETIAGETKDQVAVDFLMGHCPASNDMAAVYRQRIDDSRLLAVVQHVRAWLMPDKSQFQIDENKRRKTVAIEINSWWEASECLQPIMLRTALERLGISQTELAKGTGYCLDWVNTLVRARKQIGSDAEIRLCAFIQQLSEGREPTPLTDEQLRPKIPGPLDVPLSNEVVAALSRSPFGTAELRLLVDCLRGCEITQITLAEWWGYPYKAVRNMSSGERRIPAKAAERLREIFAIEPAQNGGAE